MAIANIRKWSKMRGWQRKSYSVEMIGAQRELEVW